MSVISNTTVIINFAAIGQLEVLHQLFGILSLPAEVYAELRAGQAEGYAYLDGIEQIIAPLSSDGWLQLVGMHGDAELRQYGALPAGLHQGESACLAIAKQRGWLLLTDDRAARAEARRQQIRISGSIGCLVMAVDRAILTRAQANAALAAMIAQGYHAPFADLSALLDRKSDPHRTDTQ